MVCGLIIAGGKGERINPLSFEFQKCMLPIANKPIMQYQIEFFQNIGVKDIAIIVAFQKKQIMDYFGSGVKFGVRIQYLDVSKDYPEGLAKAVEWAKPLVKDEKFVVFLGDIFLELKNVGKIKKIVSDSSDKNAYVVVKHEKNCEEIKKNFSVEADAKGKIFKVVEKPSALPNDLKGCGLYIFPKEIFKAIEQTPRSKTRGMFELTDAIQTLIDLKVPTFVLDIVEDDANITFISDVLKVNLAQLKKMKKDSLIGENVSIPVGAEVSNSIIGDDVKIEKPVMIKNTVVFSSSKLFGNENLENYVVTPKQKLLCNGL